MIWQRIGTHRASVFRGGGGRSARRVRAWRHERRSRVIVVPPPVDQALLIDDARLAVEPARPAAPMTTVAVLRGQEAELDAVVARLAELAVSDELLVIFGSTSCPRRSHHAVVAGLRGHLPRHDVVTVRVGDRGGDIRREGAALDRLMNGGSLPVVVTDSGAVPDIAARITSYVGADRVVRVFRTATETDLFQVWRRPPEPMIG